MDIQKLKTALLIGLTFFIGTYGVNATTPVKLILSNDVKGAYEFFRHQDDGEYFAVSPDGQYYGASYSKLDRGAPFPQIAKEKCQLKTEDDCVIFANSKSVLWEGKYEWSAGHKNNSLTCLNINELELFRKFLLQVNPVSSDDCKDGEMAFSKYQLEYVMQVLGG